MRAVPALINVLVVFRTGGNEVQNEYEVLRYDERGERDDTEIADAALTLAVREVYGPGATWYGEYRTATDLWPGEGPTVRWCGAVGGVTTRPGLKYLDSVWTEVWILTR